MSEFATRPGRGGAARDILRLAVPAFLALIAEPLFLLVDSAIIGHLGTAELAGLGVASAALVTGAGIFVFLAYGTTSVVAGTSERVTNAPAIGAGIDGFWLALALGTVTAAVVAVWAEPISAAFGASPAVVEQATTYLRVSAFGLPGCSSSSPSPVCCAACRTPLRRSSPRWPASASTSPSTCSSSTDCLGHSRIRLGLRHRPDRHGSGPCDRARHQGPGPKRPSLHPRARPLRHARAHRCSCAPTRAVRCCC